MMEPTENAGQEGPSKTRGWKMQDLQMQDPWPDNKTGKCRN